jgi:hypothetical protein
MSVSLRRIQQKSQQESEKILEGGEIRNCKRQCDVKMAKAIHGYPSVPS